MRRILQRYAAIFMIFTLLFTGCEPGIPSFETPENQLPTIGLSTSTPRESTPTLEPDPVEETPASDLTPTALPPDKEQITYRIDGNLNFDRKIVGVDQQIWLEGLLDGVREMALVVEPNRYYNGFELGLLEVDEAMVENYSLNGNQLRFELPDSVSSSGNALIHLTYTIQLPEIPPPSEMFKPQPYGYTNRQVNLVDWYPFVPPLDEQKEWVIHQPPYFGESLVYPTSDYEVHLSIIDNDVPLMVAASSPADRTENTYSFSMLSSRTFAISVSPAYAVLEGEASGLKIRSYAFPGYEAQNQVVLQNAIEAVNLYSEMFGNLPHESVSIVQADFLDGMEFDGLYFLSKGFYDLYDGTVKGYLSLITVHEMAHQWWFGVVGNDQAMEPWLDEGLATFAELQYIERYYPELVDWWWIYRVNIYDPQGWINLSIYDYSSYLAYRNAVYLRGAAYIYDFREQLGITEFNTGMKQYFSENYREIATREDFYRAFPTYSGDSFSEINAKYLVIEP